MARSKEDQHYVKYIGPHPAVAVPDVDGEFVRNLPASKTDQLILGSIVDMSKGLGKTTIAEFVGDDETVGLLRESPRVEPLSKAFIGSVGVGEHLVRAVPPKRIRQ